VFECSKALLALDGAVTVVPKSYSLCLNFLELMFSDINCGCSFNVCEVKVNSSLYLTKYDAMKTSLYLTKHHAIKTYGGVEIQLHVSLTWRLQGGG
jgi:hypothetical protein